MATALASDLRTRLDMPLVEAILGRRSRRFAMGASIPEGALKFTSKHDPVPLTEEEKMLVLLACGANTGWHYAHPYNPRYAPHLPNYAGSAGGRTFPSGAGFETVELFFTDDTGVYFLPTRDAPALADIPPDGAIDLPTLIDGHRSRIRKLADGRMRIPREEPYVESHNLWIANIEGSLLVIPVGDLAQHVIANLCYYLQNGRLIYDDVNRREIPGIERFAHLAGPLDPIPLTFLEQYSFGECTAEIATACYSGALMLQAMGLGGWMYDGIDPFVILGASGDADVPGLGFRYDLEEGWALPNPTGLPGVFEGYCPPHYPDMRAAVAAFVRRKFGPGGPFHPDTPGPWKDTSRVRGSAQVHGEEFIECVTLMAQYIRQQFGKFPGTVPSILALTYLQAHHLDLDFYNHHFGPGAYLRTHAEHMSRWHGDREPDAAV